MRAITAISFLLTAAIGLGCAETAAQGGAEAVDGEAVLRDVAAAYRDAPALVDEVDITVTSNRGSRSGTARIEVGAGTDARIMMDGFTITAVDSRIAVEHERSRGKYLTAALQGDIIESFKSVAGALLPAPQCVLRYGATDEEYVQALGLGRAGQLRLYDARRYERDGRPYYELRLHGSTGATSTVHVDADTNLLHRIEVDTGGGMGVKMQMNPTSLEQLPSPLGLPQGELRRVNTFNQLMKLSKGDPAPDFTLETLDGKRVTLSELEGSMVVLDFWASWCGPCKVGLPKLDEFAKWAHDEGLPVRVLPVNIGERVPTAQARKERVSAFWRSKGFSMPTLMDYDDSVAVAYDVGPIPHSVVVGPDGRIVDVQTGFDPNMAGHLRTLADRLVGKQAG